MASFETYALPALPVSHFDVPEPAPTIPSWDFTVTPIAGSSVLVFVEALHSEAAKALQAEALRRGSCRQGRRTARLHRNAIERLEADGFWVRVFNRAERVIVES